LSGRFSFNFVKFPNKELFQFHESHPTNIKDNPRIVTKPNDNKFLFFMKINLKNKKFDYQTNNNL
jgi:hypothetical protein